MITRAQDEPQCPGEDTVLRYFAGHERENAGRLERHVDGCTTCRELFAVLAQTSLGVPPLSADTAIATLPLGAHLPKGSVVGRYSVQRVLGRGGMGVVYEAYDPHLLRFVALKVLRADLAERAGSRLRSEARAMARLSHPNVCPVFDVGEVQGRHYLTMACVRGGTLVDWLQARPRAIDDVCRMFTAAGHGLAAAHAIGVVHRDFKPANVLIDAQGRALVCDFGLAATDRDPTLLRGGTPRYMAPEQRDGRGDERVDQYAFAVACSDALARLPVPRRVRAVLERARLADPGDRYPDMEALLEALSSSLRSRPIRAPWPIGVAVAGLAALLVLPRPAEPVAVPMPFDGGPPAPPEVHPAVDALLDLATAYEQAGDPQGALVVLDLAVQEADERQEPAGVAVALAARGSMLGAAGRPAEAVEQLEDAFHRCMEIGREDVAAEAAIVLLGLLARELQQPQRALTWGRHVEGTLGRMETLEPPLVAAFDQAMSMAFQASGDLDTARARAQQGVDVLRQHSPEFDERLPVLLGTLAGFEIMLQEHDAGLRSAEEAYELSKRLSGPDHPQTGSILGQLAYARQASGDASGALEALRGARAIVVTTYGPSHPNLLSIDAGLGSMLIGQGRYEEALTAMDDALARTPNDFPIRCALQERAGASLLFLEQCERARPRLRDAIDCYESFGRETEQLARARRQLARCGG